MSAWIILASLLIYNFLLPQWAPTICYPCITISELLSCTPWKTTLSTRIQCLGTILFFLGNFQSYFDCRHLTPPPEFRLYICNTIRFSCHDLYSILGSPDLLFFFLNSYTKFYFLCYKVLWVLRNPLCLSLCLSPQYYTQYFHSTKNISCVFIQPFPFSKPLATTDFLFQVSFKLSHYSM